MAGVDRDGRWMPHRPVRRVTRAVSLLLAPDLRVLLDYVEEAIAAIMAGDDELALERLHVVRQALRG
jgi:hypothetical protein